MRRGNVEMNSMCCGEEQEKGWRGVTKLNCMVIECTRLSVKKSHKLTNL